MEELRYRMSSTDTSGASRSYDASDIVMMAMMVMLVLIQMTAMLKIVMV